jgi:hypothetical protein
MAASFRSFGDRFAMDAGTEPISTAGLADAPPRPLRSDGKTVAAPVVSR